MSVGGEWDEASLNAALAHLQEMHIRLRDLRGTIPRIIKPMLDSHSSPEGLYTEFSHSAMAAAKDVRAFADLMEDGESKVVLEKAKKRRSESEDRITAWRVTEHEGWLDHEDPTLSKQDHGDAQDDDLTDTRCSNGQDKDSRVIVESFMQDHPGMNVVIDETTKVIKPEYISPSKPSRILRHKPLSRYPAKNPHICMSQYCGASQPDPDLMIFDICWYGLRASVAGSNINSQQEMLAAYSDVKSQPCTRCGKLLDRKPQFPVIRTSKRIEAADGRSQEIWAGFHEACA
ncbi:MAG: hypothetical protein M1830_010302 [Pleopsidium flavum]|nr:MAG: hypothetical protein M1830_010302 [Pleopsidium flavum]